MSNYLNLGPNVIGSVTVAPPPLGQPAPGELIVSVDDYNAVWAQPGSIEGVNATSISGLPIALSPAPQAGQILFVNSTATGLFYTGLFGDVSSSATTVGQITVTGLLGMLLPSPTVAGSALTYDGSGLVWSSVSGGGGGFTAGGDLSGTSMSQTVTGMQGYNLPVPLSAWWDDNAKYYVWSPLYNYPEPGSPQTDPPVTPGPAGKWYLVDIPDSADHITGEQIYNSNNGGNFYFGPGQYELNAHSIHNINVVIGIAFDNDSHTPTSYNLVLDTASLAALDPYGLVYFNNVMVNIFDSTGQAGSVPINITTTTPTLMSEQGFTSTINGNSSYVINQNYGSVSLILSIGVSTSNHSILAWNWIVLSHT